MTFAGASKAEVVIARLREAPPTDLDQQRSEALLRVLADIMDLPISPDDDFFGPPGWREAERLIPELVARIGGRTHDVIIEAFRDGRVIGWLVNLLRRETFAHGRYGYRPRDESDWLLAERDYDAVASVMLQRFKKMSLKSIFSTPRSIELLFAWKQLNDEEGVRELFQNQAASDEDFLYFLERMKTRVYSSSGD